FTALGAQPRERLAAIDADGSLDPSWAACSSPSDAGCGADGPVEALAVAPDATTVYVGGGFAKLGGLGDRPYLGALDLASGAPTAWRPAGAPDGWVLALAVSGSTLYAGGSFTHLGGDARRGVAALDTT